MHANLGGRDDGRQVVAGFPRFATNPYLLTIGLFILLYTAIQAFIYFETTELLRIYEEREQRTTILALRDAVANILTFGLGLFVTGRLVKRLGMPRDAGAAAGLLRARLPDSRAWRRSSRSCSRSTSRGGAANTASRGPAREMLFTSVDRETRVQDEARRRRRRLPRRRCVVGRDLRVLERGRRARLRSMS